MKKLKYTVDLEKLKLSQPELEMVLKDNQKSMFENMLNMGLGQKSINGKDGRILYRIYLKLDESRCDYLFLEESEFDLIKSVFCDENVRFQPGQYRLICQYQENIDIAKDIVDGIKTG